MTVPKPVGDQATLPTPNPTKSFWHTEPSKLLLGHRTTAALPPTADIVIVGSGISGASAAHYFREDEEGKGLNIVMLEAREACWGATGRVSDHGLMTHDSTIFSFKSNHPHRMEDTVNPWSTPTRQR